MNKMFCTILFLILSLSIAFSADASVLDISPPTNIFYGKPADINVTIETDVLSGTINFWFNSSITEQRSFSAGTTLMVFTKTFTNLGDHTIRFSLTNFTGGTDTNSLNDLLDANILVKKGVDFYINSVSTEPTTNLPAQNSRITAFVKNVGDFDFNGENRVTFFFDGNQVGETSFTNLDVNQTKEVFLDYTIPDYFSGDATIMVQVNKTASSQEFDYTNNTRLFEITEDTGINLRVNSISVNTSPIRLGELAEFKVNVQNTGGQTATNILVGIYKTAISNTTKIGEYTITSLAGKTAQDITFTQFFSTVGTDSLFVFIDPLNNISEYNENDNDQVISITVEDSNTIMSMGEYLSTLAVLDSELKTCESDLISARLERDVALNSVVALTKERDSCNSNLNICNSDNATFFATTLDDIRQTVESDSNATDEYYFSELRQKDEEISLVKSEANSKVVEAEKYALFGYALAAFIIIINVVGFVAKYQKKRLDRVG